MKLGRNQPCHCGSGVKYKLCCLTKDKKTKPPPKRSKSEVAVDSRALHRAGMHMALLGGLAQEFPQPIRNQGMEGFYDELRRHGHTEEEIKEAREILKEPHR